MRADNITPSPATAHNAPLARRWVGVPAHVPCHQRPSPFDRIRHFLTLRALFPPPPSHFHPECYKKCAFATTAQFTLLADWLLGSLASLPSAAPRNTAQHF